MTKTTQKATRLFFKCQPCDEIEDRDRTYTRSYDLVAHLVNTHKLYPVSIKHNATYLPLKSDLRAATVEEILKYKDANKHGRKRAAESTSTGEVNASGTAAEPEAPTGTSGEREGRKDKGGKRDSVRVAKVREGKGSNRDPSCDEERRARETADEKDAAEDAADKKEYLALQSKMEARRIAREIQIAHDTLASLRAEQDGVSAQSETVPKTRVENDRTGDEDATGTKLETKRARASRIAANMSLGESEAPSTEAPRRAEGHEKTKPIKSGGVKATDVTGAPKKPVVKIRMKRPTCATEPSRTATEKTTTRPSGEDLMTEALGPALVAGALGRKIGDARTATMMRGITECRVELLTTRQKAKLPVPAVPHNSAESNSAVDGSGAYDARLSLSATD